MGRVCADVVFSASTSYGGRLGCVFSHGAIVNSCTMLAEDTAGSPLPVVDAFASAETA